MPKPEEAEEKKTSETEETEDGGVAVSLEEDSQKEVVVQEEKKKIPKPEKKEDEPKKQEIFYALRNLPKLEREIENLRIQISSLAPSEEKKEISDELDEIDVLAQKDWKSAVNKLAEMKFSQLKEEEKRQIGEEQQRLNISQKLERNAKAVLEKHPDLNDQTSEKSQIWHSILDNNPDWRTSPDGPLLVMYEMENELRKRGYDLDGVESKVEKEVMRVARASSSSLPSSKSLSGTNKIVLTKEQRDFCDTNGISYENYARTLKTGDTRQGVEI